MSLETNPAARVDFLREIIGGMPKKRYQDGALEIRHDVTRPYYFVRYSVPEQTPDGLKNKRRAKILGYVDETTEKKAEKARAKFLDQLNDGRLVAQATVRFRDLVKKFVATRVPQLGSAAQDRYRNQIALHILPAWGDMRLSEISSDKIEAWLSAKAQPRKGLSDEETPGLGWWSRVGLKGIMSAIFKAAKDWGALDGDSPCKGVRIGRKREVREKRILTRGQLQGLLAKLDEQVRFMVLISFATGFRISEILGLKWGDLNFDEAKVRVDRSWHRGSIGEPKTPESRRTRQLGPLVDDFRRKYPGPHAADKFIFADATGFPPDDRDVQRERLRPVARDLGIYFNGFGFRTFRRQNVTLRQTIGGATPIEAQKMAGHTKMDTTMIYTITEDEREREQLGKMLDWLMETKQEVVKQ